MNVLIKPHQFSRIMQPAVITAAQWEDAFEHPQVVPEKSAAPLAIYGTMVASPEPDPQSGLPRCTGGNVDRLWALQLDFDAGITMDTFAYTYEDYSWAMYTSYSYGFKDGDRFRVILPLKTPMPCRLLANQRVRKNLLWHFRGTDPSCFSQGHWQIVPCIRAEGAPYVHRKNKGERWGGDDFWEDYARWVQEDAEEERKRFEAAASRTVNVDRGLLLDGLRAELAEIPVGSGMRHEEVKRLLAKYIHKGVGDALLSLENPWPSDREWDREWSSLVEWFVRKA